MQYYDGFQMWEWHFFSLCCRKLIENIQVESTHLIKFIFPSKILVYLFRNLQKNGAANNEAQTVSEQKWAAGIEVTKHQ